MAGEGVSRRVGRGRPWGRGSIARQGVRWANNRGTNHGKRARSAGVGGDFNRCLRVIHHPCPDVEVYRANRHKEATGKGPGRNRATDAPATITIPARGDHSSCPAVGVVGRGPRRGPSAPPPLPRERTGADRAAAPTEPLGCSDGRRDGWRCPASGHGPAGRPVGSDLVHPDHDAGPPGGGGVDPIAGALACYVYETCGSVYASAPP